MSREPRRSRKHVLDWIGCEDFRPTLNALLVSSGVRVGGQDIHRPLGHGDGVEFELPDFCWCFRRSWKVHDSLRSWWLPSPARKQNARTPVWDLISTCNMLGRKGLLLVEAKAHQGELDWSGEPLHAKAGEQSQSSHDHIRTAVGNISNTLAGICGGKVILDVEARYRLTRRVAWAAFLASQGISVALLCLGFTGDSTVPGFLKDDAHWQRLMGAYMIGKLSLGLPERRVSFPGGGVFTFLIRSRPVSMRMPKGRRQRSFEQTEVKSPKSERSAEHSKHKERSLIPRISGIRRLLEL